MVTLDFDFFLEEIKEEIKRWKARKNSQLFMVNEGGKIYATAYSTPKYAMCNSCALANYV